MREAITLKISRGREPGREFSFAQRRQSIIIGRQNDCIVRLPDMKVSRHHCELDIEIDPPRIRIRDLGSLNGTYINGALVGRRDLEMEVDNNFIEMRDGDRLGIGSACELLLSIPADEAIPEIAGYKAVAFLGRGGTGKVWHVRREADGADFALKMVDVRGRINRNDQLRFVRGARLAEQLTHPHIVCQEAYKIGEDKATYHIVQEYCRGGNIYNLMKRFTSPLPIEMATHIILQVLDALDYAHHVSLYRDDGRIKIGLVHRDITPGNILLMDDSGQPTAKIGDFGLSKLFELTDSTAPDNLITPTGTGDFAGTPDFTPAVQIKNYRKAKPEVDVWAAAAVFYFMLTGCPPKDLSYAEKWKLALLEKAIPIRKRNSEIPIRLAKVIDAALVEEPIIGCQSARELKERIEAACSKRLSRRHGGAQRVHERTEGSD
ncbi:MAG TPA: hypothetical protein DEB25_00115 [Desulfobulbaceae bacterium]|nr:hypothetical protein [Desulfobulbaceae bacterium]